jgi:hypothetical protein
MGLIFRSAGFVYYLPTVVSLVLVPLLSLQFRWTEKDSDLVLRQICDMMQILLPICSIWWVYLMKREKLEGDGRELFRAYEPGWWGDLAESLLCLIWYWLHVALVILLHSIWFPAMNWAFLQILAESSFFTGLYLLLANTIRNTGISLMFLLLYYVIVAFLPVGSLHFQVSVFTLGEIPSGAQLGRDLWVAGLGWGFFLAGHWMGRRFRG